MQRPLPEILECFFFLGSLPGPVIAHDVVVRFAGIASQQSGDLVRRVAAFIKRRDQRLNDSDSAVVGSRVTPGFEVVGRGDMPLAKLAGFVVVQPRMYA